MNQANVSEPNFDNTVFEGEVFAVIDTEQEYRRCCDALTGNRIDVTESLNLPQGKHLVKLTLTAEVMRSEFSKPVGPSPDDLRQERIAEKAAAIFDECNGKLVTNGNGNSTVTDLF